MAYRFLRHPIQQDFQSSLFLKVDSGFHCHSGPVSEVFVVEKMAAKKNKTKLEQDHAKTAKSGRSFSFSCISAN